MYHGAWGRGVLVYDEGCIKFILEAGGNKEGWRDYFGEGWMRDRGSNERWCDGWREGLERGLKGCIEGLADHFVESSREGWRNIMAVIMV